MWLVSLIRGNFVQRLRVGWWMGKGCKVKSDGQSLSWKLWTSRLDIYLSPKQQSGSHFGVILYMEGEEARWIIGRRRLS